MNSGSVLFLLVCISAIILGCSPTHQPGDPSLSSESDSSIIGNDDPATALASLEIFTRTLYPLIEQNCAGCHGVSQQPQFAGPTNEDSHNALISFGLIDFDNPDNSRIVQKIRGGHQSFPISLADDLSQAITDWASEIANNGGGNANLPPPPVLEATFTSIHALILVPKCLGCHNPGGEEPNIDYTDYQTSLQTGQITPGDPDDSDMYSECADGDMPLNGPMLSAAELAAIEQWIGDGAMNN